MYVVPQLQYDHCWSFSPSSIAFSFSVHISYACFAEYMYHHHPPRFCSKPPS